MKNVTAIVVVGLLTLTSVFLSGCGSKGDDISNMSRADQQKAMMGDPAKAKEMGEQMKARYVGKATPPASSGPGK